MFHLVLIDGGHGFLLLFLRAIRARQIRARANSP
jgi:hypothetical protein